MKRFGIFYDAGLKGLYGGLGRDDIKKVKGIAEADDLLDCIDREELAANEFRITQTEAKLKRDGVQGEERATTTHYTIGKRVRTAIEEIQGTMPEKLPAVPSIKKLADKQSKDTKKLKAEENQTLLRLRHRAVRGTWKKCMHWRIHHGLRRQSTQPDAR